MGQGQAGKASRPPALGRPALPERGLGLGLGAALRTVVRTGRRRRRAKMKAKHRGFVFLGLKPVAVGWNPSCRRH